MREMRRQVPALLMLCCAAAGTSSLEEENKNLLREVELLKGLVAVLEKRCLEKRSPEDAPASASPTPAPTQAAKASNSDMGWDTPDKIPRTDRAVVSNVSAADAAGVTALGRAGELQTRLMERMGVLEGMQPGTPPTPEDIANLVHSAKRAEHFMCETWPDNDACRLLRGDEQFGPFQGPAASTESIERDLAWKLVLRDESLVVSVMGSSSTAGHGAWFNSSYAVTLMRVLRPVFATIGVEFEVRNQAMGGWDYRMGPIWCMPQIAGEDADVVTWEWSMFGPDMCTLETYQRAALALPRRPGLIFTWTSGPLSGGKFWGDLYKWACADRNAPEGSPKKVTCVKVLRNGAELPQGRQGGGDGTSLPCGAAESWENVVRNGECFRQFNVGRGKENLTDEFLTGVAEEFFKTHTRPDPAWKQHPPDSVDEQIEHYSSKGYPAVKFRSSGLAGQDWKPWWLYRHPVFRNSHHPGSFGHLITGHMFSVWLLERVHGALVKIKKDLQGTDMAGLQKEYRSQRDAHRARPLPEPVYCSKPGIELKNGSVHKCYTNFRPRHDLSSSIDKLVVENSGWAVATWAKGMKDDGLSYRDHKLITAAKVSPTPGALKLRFHAPAEGTSVEVGICLYGKYVSNQAGEVECGGTKIAVALGKDLEELGAGAEVAATFPLPSTGKTFSGSPAKKAGDHGVPNPLDAHKNPCRLVCKAQPGAEVEMVLRAKPGKQFALSHIIAVPVV